MCGVSGNGIPANGAGSNIENSSHPQKQSGMGEFGFFLGGCDHFRKGPVGSVGVFVGLGVEVAVEVGVAVGGFWVAVFVGVAVGGTCSVGVGVGAS